ncbi:MAG TPA: hydroxyacylglutathione hydrolase [Dongiaceae bacterium]|jgi:hydroxyacylglutathione hydrolase|nr:hydroxyacylglutathione hydrolase [Dongiaceae bacterium]
MKILPVPLLRDNYAWLLIARSGKEAAILDPSEAAPVLSLLERLQIKLTHILNTHHHHDHCGGNERLRAETGAPIFGPEYDRGRIPGLTHGLREGDTFSFDGTSARIFHIPGHTTGHIAYVFPEAVFCGDTLFSLGCGRLFEGTAEQMWHSLVRLRELPDQTAVYCGHEYTESNHRFAMSLEPDNAALAKLGEEIAAKRQAGKTTVPSTVGVEKAFNPFLRADDPALAACLGLARQDPVEIFAALRDRKDKF